MIRLVHNYERRGSKMPIVGRFYGIAIRIYRRDHNPPHFHAVYGGQEAIFTIADLKKLEGELPRRVILMVLEWAFQYRDELMENWQRALNGEDPRPIPPLD
jgi:hypothetical protein